MAWRLVKHDTGETVVADLRVADGFWSRAVGLQFKAPLPAGAGLLLVPCPSVHTAFVRAPLDIVMLDRTGQVIAVRPAVKPWRVVPPVRGCHAILEVPGGSTTVAAGDRLRLEGAEGRGPAPRSLTFLTGTDTPEAAPNEKPAVPPSGNKVLVWCQIFLLCLIACVAYSNSLLGVFVLDDWPTIVEAPAVKHGWPGWKALATNRPVITLSLALNYRLSGLRPASYHTFNGAVHLLAALALFGTLRRTLLRVPGYADRAAWFAFAVAAVWLTHPLQTESVTYVIQRCESLMGLFFLLTFYAVVRGADAARSAPWYAAAVLACGLGMATKEVMAAAPVLLLLYDRIFLAESWREAMRRRWALHIGLISTWAILAAPFLFYYTPGNVGFGLRTITPLEYLQTQAGAILHYLRLALWPNPLCFDYFDWPVARQPADWLPQGLVVLGLLGLTLLALWRRPRLGFLGAWFFLILAPTSSFVPIADRVVEHRMYLPLAAVILLVVLAVDRLLHTLFQRLDWRRATAGILLVGVVIANTALTLQRNRDYQSEQRLWTDTLEKRPNNIRARSALGDVAFREGRYDDALTDYQTAVKAAESQHFLLPISSLNNLGLVQIRLGRLNEAITSFARVPVPDATDDPAFLSAVDNLGFALWLKNEPVQAERCFRRSAERRPQEAEHHFRLALALYDQGKTAEAREACAVGLRLDPDWPARTRRDAWQKATHVEARHRFGAYALFLARQVAVADGDDPQTQKVVEAARAEAGLKKDGPP